MISEEPETVGIDAEERVSFLRASASPLLLHLSPKGGTVNQPSTRVSYRKHTVGNMQGRNVPVHAFSPVPTLQTVANAIPNAEGLLTLVIDSLNIAI